MIPRNLKLLVSIYRSEGALEVVRRLAFRFRQVHTYSVYRLCLSDAIPDGHSPPGVEIKEVSKEELRELRKGRDDLTEYFFRDETEDLDRCWVGVQGGRLGFISWVSYRGSELVRCGPKEAKVSYVYCMKELRGKHMTTNAVLMIARTLHQEGISSVLAVPDSDNPTIVKAFLACGFEKIGTIKRIGLFSWPPTPVDFSKRVRPC
jgi:RimJ/RimL family protein N-acetyltransferase